MLFTVKEVSALSHVTVKTLHHYHKIGLLPPCEITEAGYRLYGAKELERLQHILFYRELDFPLAQIKRLLDEDAGRLSILSEQRELLAARKQRIERLLHTLNESIDSAANGKTMDEAAMFQGFQTEEAWTEALADQQQYLKETYDYDMLADNTIDVDTMNEQAKEAVRFMSGMAQCLREGVKFDDERVRSLIHGHLAFDQSMGGAAVPAEFAAQARFFREDDFHRGMLESQQTGLAYYICAAAEAFAAE